ncbi:MAG: hypothetical protein K2J82_12465 [Muribaculaceae bacterium]|nr:hypothetical protein [Muribaculaceae bacterium]
MKKFISFLLTSTLNMSVICLDTLSEILPSFSDLFTREYSYKNVKLLPIPVKA